MSPAAKTYYCSVTGCGKHRDGDVNHWLVLFAEKLGSSSRFVAHLWNAETADHDGAVYACGYDHASILFARWMSQKNFVDPAKAVRT